KRKSPPQGGPFIWAVRQSQYYIEDLINFETTLEFSIHPILLEVIRFYDQ
ncbi:hypothetical protein Q604_UNBc4C00326G0002, partial [human gut metagenome]